ncbi:hypothetical protein, conserved [Trypanosoma brucei gambiense DAL972]|uniref:AB hydrolase-1 domain-containing protein n=1 Tax=Trypanosoma brucei gambiense (strain MHOM/CI/86/DAL972) TaxID=679716 RepID=C9ZU35_TRYB9|nr:hypothetical protein, conserved [Trypanosoma brucei gambiense DAL972]6HIV_BG Chain BG, mL73 [Trypanosoma brucei brucei]6HIX_BG Chain BG, ml73 [Trypanosoma brucei brucei]CBH12921.1 hypothetical protein, conserved [Trypanosoma brucei gambiense DAL972]|eukprot:XP_011775200.1 hypothetical protein, conserved [Trypanosoma brucei gambiense DAL972]
MRLARTLHHVASATTGGGQMLEGLVNDGPEVAHKQHASFTPFSIQPWQARCVGASRRKLLPQMLMYHGARLGPRPLIILDHSTKGEAGVAEAARKYESILSQLSWDYGAVYIPLHAQCTDSSKDLLEQSCQRICAVMDALDVRWTHFLTYSYGALVAVRMASSQEFPHRVGTLMSLDTPLVTREFLRNMEQREDIAKAERDINVPEDGLAFAKQALLSSLEGPLPCPAAEDESLYRDYLFDPNRIFGAGGLVRDESRYVPLKSLLGVRHPVQLIVPSANPLSDAAAHSEVFGHRRPAVVKCCQRHEDLFKESAAKEVAGVLGAWMRRFEPDCFISKRYEQAANEMGQLMLSTAQVSSESAGKGGGEPRKKKEKKKSKA